MGPARRIIVTRLIPALQIGSAIPVLLYLIVAAMSPTANLRLYLVGATMAGIYVVGFVGGILLWRKLKLGIALSIAHQIFMLPRVFLPESFAYQLQDYLYVTLGLSYYDSTSQFIFDFGGTTEVVLWAGKNDATVEMYACNFFALFVIQALVRAWPDLFSRSDKNIEGAKSESTVAS